MMRARKQSRPRNRRGFTVAEVIVAIVVFAIGMLGLTATAHMLARMITRGNRGGHGAFVAQQKIESMRATALGTGGCAALTSGSDTSGLYVRTWTVSTSGTATNIQLITTYRVSGTRTRSDTLGTTLAC